MNVPPDQFIPIAEDTGLIIGIGTWVLEESCRQFAEWSRARALPANLRIAVNVSARQLTQPNFAALVAAVLDRGSQRDPRPPRCAAGVFDNQTLRAPTTLDRTGHTVALPIRILEPVVMACWDDVVCGGGLA